MAEPKQPRRNRAGAGAPRSPTSETTLTLGERSVRISNPEKIYFPAAGLSKMDVVRHYVDVAEAALRAIGGRPLVLKRYVDGIDAPAFYQKRAPDNRPPWIETTTLRFPSGRTADEVVIRDAAQLAWIANLGCIEMHPHPVRTEDLEHPDELRIDLDPVPGVGWPEICEVALLCRDVLAAHGLASWPKTSGSRGMHLFVPIAPRWTFDEVRRAALALAREVERQAPGRATSAWWKEERSGVFIDYNQNAKDRTTAGAYSLRAVADARVSTPLRWDEVPGSDPGAFTIRTIGDRLRTLGDPFLAAEGVQGELTALLHLSAKQAAEGQEDAPWPPHFRKQAAEPKRVAPSRAADRARGEAPLGEGGADTAPVKAKRGTRQPSAPLITVARAQHRDDALAGLARWRARHPQAAAHLQDADVLVDSMRGRSSTWTRIRLNLRHVPAADRPAETTPDPDLDPDTVL